MASMILHVSVLAVAALLGFLAGLFARGADRPRGARRDGSAAERKAAVERDAAVARAEAGETAALQSYLAGLQNLTRTVATDVGAHHHCVQTINDELVAAAPAETTVLASVKSLIRANETMQSQLSTAEMRLQAQAEEIERHVREARTDALTKLGNRRAFEEELQRAAQSVREGGAPTCLLVIDVDGFQKFNATHGRPAGDEVLRGVARALRQQLTGNEIVCRHGGEEFSVLFPAMDLAAAAVEAERARLAVTQEVYPFEGQELRITVSAGLARLLPEETAEQVLRRCDAALQHAKQSGRDCGFWHDGAAWHPCEAPRLPAPPRDDPATAASDWSEAGPFLEDLDRRVAEWKRGGATLSLLLLELDNQAKITAALGAAGIDTASEAVATFLTASLRQSDHAVQVKPGRFAAILPGVPLAAAGETAKRIRTEMARSGLRIKNRKLPLTISAGLAEVTQGDDRADVVTRAENSLRAAKKAGGNCSFLSSKPQVAGATS